MSNERAEYYREGQHPLKDKWALTIDEVEEDTPYALLLSTCVGAWRYLLGNVIQFTDAETGEIEITGRTQHFLNLCGEHLSVQNMVQAVERLEAQFDVAFPEFTVMGVRHDDLFAHHWFLGVDRGVRPRPFGTPSTST